jgi:glutamate-1-semialdehyde 2,1-aminomutase
VTVNEKYTQLTPRSRALFERAEKLFPGGICHNLRALSPHPFYPTRAEGPFVYDVDGRELLDLWMGHYTMILGHAVPEVAQAASEALKGGWHWGIPCEDQIRLAEELAAAVPAMEKMRFCCTGTEATMYAVRLARAFTRKPWVLKLAGGWHGASTDLSFAVKSPFHGAEGPGLLEPEAQAVEPILFNDIEGSRRVFEKHRGKIAAVIVEPMMGAGGFLPADPEYLRFLRQACDEFGAVLIFDEIITGFRFRYGTLADEYGVKPDLVTLGKIVGGGFPLGAYGGREEIMDLADPRRTGPGRPVLVGGGTFSCNPVSMGAGVAILRALKQRGPGLYEMLAARGERLRRGVEAGLKTAGIPAACTGKGSLFMTHILKGEDRVLRTPADLAAKTRYEVKDKELKLALLVHGVYAVHGGGSLSAAHDDAVVDRLINAYGEAAKEIGELL